LGIFGRSAWASGPGTVWGWGSNFGGILGERPGDFEEPTKIRRLSHVSSVHHDGRTAYAIKDDGSLWSWGTSASGQLGDGKRLHRESRGLWGMTPQASAADSRYRTLPDRIMGLRDVSAVFGNNFLGRWVKSRDGRAFGWGGFTERSLTPARLPALDGLLDLARTMNDVWALMPGGELIGCSANTPPRPVSGIHDVASISAAVHAFYAATRDGCVYAIDDFHGEWKDEPDLVHSRVLGKVRDIDGIATIIAADYDPAGVLAIGMDGNLWSWGIDPKTANTGRERRYPPRQVPIPNRVIDAYQSHGNAYALDEAGEVWSWDDFAFMSREEQRPRINRVKGLPRIGAIANGWQMHALGHDGSVWSWSVYDAGKDSPTEPRRVTRLPRIVALRGSDKTTLAVAGE